MSLEERTLVVRGIDDQRIPHRLLNELFNNFGPVVKIVLRPDHAFIEYKDRASVAYSFAMANNLVLNNMTLRCSPRIDDRFYHSYCDKLDEYEGKVREKKYNTKFLSADNQATITNERKKGRNISKDIISRARAYAKHYPLLKDAHNPYLGTVLVHSERSDRYRSQSSRRYDDEREYRGRRNQSPPSHQRSRSAHGRNWDNGGGSRNWEGGNGRDYVRYEQYYPPPPPVYGGYQAPAPGFPPIDGFMPYDAPYQPQPPAYYEPQRPPPPSNYHHNQGRRGRPRY